MSSVIKFVLLSILTITCAASFVTFATYFGKASLVSTLAFIFAGLSWEAMRFVIGLDIEVESAE